MTDDLVAVSWAKWRSAGDFVAAAQTAIDAVDSPQQRADIQSSLVAQLIDAACVGEEPSALLIDYFEHGMMLGVLPVNLSLEQLLASPLLAAKTPVRLRAVLPVLHSFGPHVAPDSEEAAELVLQVLIKLADLETAGVASIAVTKTARAVLNGPAVLPLIALARHARSDTWQMLLERLRGRASEPAAMTQLVAGALLRLGLRLETDTRIPPRPESLALHDEDMGPARTPTGCATSDQSDDPALAEDDDTVERQRRVRPRLISWGTPGATSGITGVRAIGARGGDNIDFLPLPRKRTELEAMVNNALVLALSAAAAEGHNAATAVGTAVCSTVAVMAQRVCDALASTQPVPWDKARALAQLFISTVSSAVSPPTVVAALAMAAVNQDGFSPEKDAPKLTKPEVSGQLSAEDVTSLSIACGRAFKATAKVLSAPPQCSPTLPLALEILAATDAALLITSAEAGAPQVLRQALLGWTETPRLVLATSWARHEPSAFLSCCDAGNSGAEQSQYWMLRGLGVFDLSSATGKEEILSFAKICCGA